MLKQNEIYQAEKLSKAIDELNNGQRAECSRQETFQLLAAAKLIKDSALQTCPPKPVLDSIVDTVANELERKERLRRGKWLLSATMGTAAVMVIAFIANNLLFFDGKQYTQLPAPETAIVVEERTGDSLKPQSPVNPPISERTAPAGQIKLEDGAPKSAPAKVQPEKDQQNGNPRTVQSSTGQPAPNPGPPADGVRTAMVSLPGKTASSVTFDKESGLIRQIYDQGTKQQVIITQRPKRPETVVASKAQEQYAIMAAPQQTTKAGAAKIADSSRQNGNKVTVMVNDDEVTVEGEQPQEELEKVAKSLVVK